MNIVLPIAGLGQRFKNGGYETPKPLIKMDGEYMIERAMKSVDYSNSKLFFIVRQEHIEQYKIDYILKEKFGDDIHVESIGYTTDGALSTCLLVEEHIDNDEPLIIFTPDCYFEPKFVAPTENKIDGMVVTFNSDSNAHSYVKIDDRTGYVIKAAEKEVISNDAVGGLYYYKKGSDFVKYSRETIKKNIRTNNEFYICPVFNYLIRDGGKVGIEKNTEHLILGTPLDISKHYQNKRLNIAVCLSGVLRDWEISVQSLIDKVLGNHNADLFIHTWEIDEEFTDDKWGVNDDGVYTDEGATDADKDRQIVDDTLNVIDNLKESGVTKIIEEEVRSMWEQGVNSEKVSDVGNGSYTHDDGFSAKRRLVEYRVDNQNWPKIKEELKSIRSRLGPRYQRAWSPHNFSCWTHSLYEANDIKNQYIQKNGKHYDLVIRLRTEIEFLFPISEDYLREVKDEHLISIPNHADDGTGKTINDQFAIAVASKMDYYCNIKNVVDKYPAKRLKAMNPHHLWGRHLDEFKIHRPQMPYLLRGMFPKGFSRIKGEFRTKMKKWWEKLTEEQQLLYSKACRKFFRGLR